MTTTLGDEVLRTMGSVTDLGAAVKVNATDDLQAFLLDGEFSVR